MEPKMKTHTKCSPHAPEMPIRFEKIRSEKIMCMFVTVHIICKGARNVHVKIYDVHKTYVHITYWTNKWFLNFSLINNILIFLHFSICIIYCSFCESPFFTHTKILSIKTCLVCPRIFSLSTNILFFLLKVFKICMVIIFCFNYHYIFIIFVLLCIKVISSHLRSQITLI